MWSVRFLLPVDAPACFSYVYQSTCTRITYVFLVCLHKSYRCVRAHLKCVAMPTISDTCTLIPIRYNTIWILYTYVEYSETLAALACAVTAAKCWPCVCCGVYIIFFRAYALIIYSVNIERTRHTCAHIVIQYMQARYVHKLADQRPLCGHKHLPQPKRRAKIMKHMLCHFSSFIRASNPINLIRARRALG